MTIRDYLKRRVRRLLAFALAVWFILPVTALVTGGATELPPLLIFIAMGLVACAIGALLFLVRCPRCNVKFGHLGMELAFHWGTRARVNYCPYCGVSLDDDWDVPKNPHR